MRTIATSILLMCSLVSTAQNYNLSLIDTVEFPGQALANIWGYADGNGNEYALVGVANGLYIVDVTDPANPVRIQHFPDGITSSWREIKTYGSFAYIASEGTDVNGDGGLGIVDMTDIADPPPDGLPFHKYTGNGPIADQLHRAHALDVDEVAGFAYIYGTTGLANKGAVCLNLAAPWTPSYAGMYDGSYIHDGYSNNNMVYGSHIYGGYFSVIDFTNKSSPQVLATQQTPLAFTHNTWLSTDGNYLFATDEKSNAFLVAYDISDINDITETDRIATTPGSGSIVHNTYVKGNHAFTSWYRDGVTITDVSRPTNLIQVARYDTYTWANGNGFQGAWGIYPYLPSGNILVSNMQQPLHNSGQGGQGGVMYILSPTLVNACYVEGTVTDAVTNLPLSNVSVQIQHSDPLNGTSTNISGAFATGQPTSGAFNVQFSRLGYITQTVPATLTNGVVTNLNVQMAEMPLPLELLSFTATPEASSNFLNWTTAQERNTLRHEVQRKTNPDAHWQKIGEVAAAGNASQHTNYQFEDLSPAIESYYRLRSLDLDGTEHFSQVLAVSRPRFDFSITSLFPNPSSGLLQLELQSDRPRLASLQVWDVFGKMVLEKQLELRPGSSSELLHLPTGWPNGQYLLKLVSSTEELTAHFLLKR